MPIRILSLPDKDLRYALDCMGVDVLIALSICSKRTKKLVKSSNRKIHRHIVHLDENYTCFDICESERVFQPKTDRIYFNVYYTWAVLDQGNGLEVWIKNEFTQSDWIAHFLSIFNEPTIPVLVIENVSLSYLDSVTQFIPKVRILNISERCSNGLTRKAFLKLAPIARFVQVANYSSENDISQFLSLNLRDLDFYDGENPFKVTSVDLLAVNIEDLSIEYANITERELNRFLKLWMKRNHTFYRPKSIRLTLEDEEIELNHQEVFKGVQYQTVDHKLRLKRGDGKELTFFVEEDVIVFEFT
ncbi:hypothetical protein B9Z55_021575 [Caenorhabditis nigoni]|uniref:F-box domain-containing protein n=1 Tax=Caenorhabditis nigoni TaxID=1611254 RepID=A0A2G5TSQ1_9PELO|nr:hypothetical protein B9Z55_021575 [Caenorhabditis nigoni]